MPINFPPNTSHPSYTGNAQPDNSAGVTDEKVPTGHAHHTDSAMADMIAGLAGGTVERTEGPLSDQTTQLFRAGRQVPLAPPPDGAAGGVAAKSLTGKFQTLVDSAASTADSGGTDSNRAQNAPDAVNGLRNSNPRTTARDFSIDDVLHLLLSVSVTEFQQSQQEAQQDLQEKVSELDASANEIAAAASKRLSGAIASGAGMIVSGALSMVSAGVNFGGAVRANSAVSGLDATQQAGQFQMLTSKTTAAASAIQSSGSGIQGGMGILQGEDEREATAEDVAKAKDDKAAAVDDSLHENAMGMKQQYLAVMQDYLDKEKGWEQSQNQAMMTVAHSV